MPDLPDSLRAALDRLGVRTPPPPREPRPETQPAPWRPAYDGEEPPW